MKNKILGKLKWILAVAAMAVVWPGVLSSCDRPDGMSSGGMPVAPGTKNKFFTAVNSHELRSTEGTKFEVVTDAVGGIASINAIRGGEIQPIRCECHSACSPNSGDACQTKYEEETGWTKVTCLGSCHTSEIKTPCGGCQWVYPTPGSDSGSTGQGSPMNPGVVNAPIER